MMPCLLTSATSRSGVWVIRGNEPLRIMQRAGHPYVWVVRKTKCPCCHARSVAIADASGRGSVVHFPGPAPFGDPVSVTPALIAARIREARRLGWEPGADAASSPCSRAPNPCSERSVSASATNPTIRYRTTASLSLA